MAWGTAWSWEVEGKGPLKTRLHLGQERKLCDRTEKDLTRTG
jgi:hypothetical protein